MSEIDGKKYYFFAVYFLSEIDGKIICGNSMRTYQGIVSTQHQGIAIVNNHDEAPFEEARAHADFLDKYMGGGYALVKRQRYLVGG